MVSTSPSHLIKNTSFQEERTTKIDTIEGKKVYHAGDTDLTPEVKSVIADVVLLPVGGTYTMDAEQAALAANLIKPEVAIPMHYGSIVGSEEDAEKFKDMCDVNVEILQSV